MTTSSSLSSTTSSQEILGRSLERMTRQAPKLETFDALAVSGKFDAQREQAQTNLIDVQNDVSAAQTSEGSLSQIQSLLSQMGELASSSTSDSATSAAQFKALQSQLQTALSSLSANDLSATSALVAKTDDGNYEITLSTADLSETITGASDEVASERSDLSDSLARLNQRAALLQIESANLNSPVGSLKNQEDAASATEAAKSALFSQPSAALAQSAGRAPGSAFKLLQD